MKTTSIMIVGVGGQGTLLASKLLGNVLIGQGYDVKLSEVHGMSQRGGSVVTYVRYGDKVYSPIVDEGEADYILSFEILESARWISYLKEGGHLITNTQKTWPMPVITGAAAYPDNIVEKLSAMADVTAVDALALAHHGTDRFGTFLPAHFTAWGYGQMSVLLSYCMVPFFRLFGMNAVTARLPMLLWSFAGMAAAYGLLRRLLGRRAALLGLLFLCICPWHFMQSRWALDCNVLPHAFLIGLALLYRGV
jgi:indolepyruvate ferredoxin oxidoreductase beta subunit